MHHKRITTIPKMQVRNKVDIEKRSLATDSCYIYVCACMHSCVFVCMYSKVSITIKNKRIFEEKKRERKNQIFNFLLFLFKVCPIFWLFVELLFNWSMGMFFYLDCFIAATPSQSSLMSGEFSLAFTLVSLRLHDASNRFSPFWQSKSGTGVEQRISFLKLEKKDPIRRHSLLCQTKIYNNQFKFLISNVKTTNECKLLFCIIVKIQLPKCFIHRAGVKIAHFTAHFS